MEEKFTIGKTLPIIWLKNRWIEFLGLFKVLRDLDVPSWPLS